MQDHKKNRDGIFAFATNPVRPALFDQVALVLENRSGQEIGRSGTP